jgi:hypothetical protein
MNPTIELVLLTGVPFVIGVIVGYRLRSYVSIVRRDRAEGR